MFCASVIAFEKTLLRDPERLAPILWRSEFRNILAGYLLRALASDRGVPLVTADAQLLSAFPRLAINLRSFAGG